MEITLSTPLTDFPGVGEVRAKKLEKLGLRRCADLLTYFPRDYEDRRKVYSVGSAPLGEKVCISAIAAEHPRFSRIRKGLDLVQLKAADQTGALHITFFNQSYVERSLRAGEEYIFFGTVEEKGYRRTMVNPIFERVTQQNFTGRIVPVYPLTAGITNHLLASLALRAVEACAKDMPETLPQGVRLEHQLAQAEFSYRNIHFPQSPEALDLARRRLTFEELFYLSAGLAMLKERRGDVSGCAIPRRPRAEFLSHLPFLGRYPETRADARECALCGSAARHELHNGNAPLERAAVAGLLLHDAHVHAIRLAQRPLRHHFVGTAEPHPVAGDEPHFGGAQKRMVGEVRGHDDGHAVSCQTRDLPQDLHLVAVVQACRRLVHDQHLRFLGKGARNQHHLALPAADLGIQLVGQMPRPQPVKAGIGHFQVVGRRRGNGADARQAPHGHHVYDGVCKRRRVALRHVPYFPSQGARRPRGNVLPIEGNGAGQGFQKAQHAAEQCGLAHAVGSQKAKRFAFRHREGQVL